MGSSTGKCPYFKLLWRWFLWFWLFAVELNLMISTETCRSPRSSMDNAVSGRDLMPQLRWGWWSQHWERSSRKRETARSEVAQMLNFSKDWKSYFYAGSFCFGRSINSSGRDAKIFFFFFPPMLMSLDSSELMLRHFLTTRSLLEAEVLCLLLHDVGSCTNSVTVPWIFNTW